MIEQYMQIQKFLQILYNLYNINITINLTPFTPYALRASGFGLRSPPILRVGLNPGANYEIECMRNM